MKRSRSRVTFLVVFLFGLAPVLGVFAQGLPATPDPDTATSGVLAEFKIRMLANPHAEVWFMRGELEPEGRLPMGKQPGQTVFYVETGSLTIEAEGTVITHEGDVTEARAEEPITLNAESSVMLVPTTEATATNPSSEPTTFLVLMMYSATVEGSGEGPMEEPVGVSQAPVAVGAAEFLPVPATVTIERVVVEPGDSMQNVTLTPLELPQGQGVDPGWTGMDLGRIESGSAEVTFEQTSLQNIVWPPMMSDSFQQPEPVTLTGTARVGEGESYAAFGSILTFTNTGDEPLTILRVLITPQLGP